jgi:hypothetical protein
MGVQRGIKSCTECHQVCLKTLAHLLPQTTKRIDPALLDTLLDCAEICHASASFMLRGSGYHGHLCAVCATICENCAVACERVGDDLQLQLCAETCRSCAASCREMLAEAA